MKPFLFSLLFPFICTHLLYASEDRFLREPVHEGIDAVYDLDFAKAQKIFDQLRMDYPESPVPYGMTAIRAWNELIFSARNLAIYKYGIPTPFDSTAPRLKESIYTKERLFLYANQALQDFCDKLLKQNPRNLLALYFKGVSYENLSTQVLTLERRLMLSTNYAKSAGKLHKQVLELDPNFVDAETSTAVPEYVIGSFNFSVRWLALLLGIHGDKRGAVRKLQEVAEKGIYRATDAAVALGLLEEWKGDPQRAISFFSSVRARHPCNFMCDISLAFAYEDAGKDPNSAIKIYQELLRDMPSKAPGVHPGEIYFRMGKDYVSLHYYSLALEQFQRAVQETQGDAETKPLAYYQMGMVYETRNDKERAKDCYRQAVKYGGSNPLIEKEIAQARKKLQ